MARIRQGDRSPHQDRRVQENNRSGYKREAETIEGAYEAPDETARPSRRSGGRLAREPDMNLASGGGFVPAERVGSGTRLGHV